MFKAIYTPQFPRLMAAAGDKCGRSAANRRSDLVPMKCVRPAGHTGNHLQDVDPRYIRPDWTVAR
jgi:hypothetical protein